MPERNRSHAVDYRGNTTDRRRRKDWMLSEEGGFGGDGKTVPCYWCGRRLPRYLVQADRLERGGRYIRSNVVPACGSCNTKRNHRELTPYNVASRRKEH